MSASDSDVVEPLDGDDDVVEGEAGEGGSGPQPAHAGRGPYAEKLWPVLFCNASHAVAFAQARSSVANVLDAASVLGQQRVDVDGAVCCVEAWVVELHRLREPVAAGQPATLATVVVNLQKTGRDADVLSMINKGRVRGIRIVQLAPDLVEGVTSGLCQCFCSVPVTNLRRIADLDFPLPLPSRAQFRKAATERLSRTGVVHRARKRTSAELGEEGVQQRVLWARSFIHARNQSNFPELVQAIIAARHNSWDSSSSVALTEEQLMSERVRAFDLVRIDAVACLLQRREVRREGKRVVRGIRCDASAKLNSEILGVEVETISGLDVNNRRVEAMPGATLISGCLKLPHTLFTFLWGFYLVFGPSIAQMRKALASVRWIVTDFGVESSMGNAYDCLEAFMHWAKGGDAASSPPVDETAFLFPNAVFSWLEPSVGKFVEDFLRGFKPMAKSTAQAPPCHQILTRQGLPTRLGQGHAENWFGGRRGEFGKAI